jgi:hypothetical protein
MDLQKARKNKSHLMALLIFFQDPEIITVKYLGKSHSNYKANRITFRAGMWNFYSDECRHNFSDFPLDKPLNSYKQVGRNVVAMSCQILLFAGEETFLDFHCYYQAAAGKSNTSYTRFTNYLVIQRRTFN